MSDQLMGHCNGERKTVFQRSQGESDGSVAGGGISDASAAVFHMPKQTVSDWKRVAIATVRTEKRIAECLLDYLVILLETLTAMVSYFGDEQWLAKQRPRHLAILHGVLADKLLCFMDFCVFKGFFKRWPEVAAVRNGVERRKS